MFKQIITSTFVCILLLTGCANSSEKLNENSNYKLKEKIEKTVGTLSLGRKLTTGDGMTLYTYDPKKGAVCSDGCSIWPPYGYARNDSPSALATEKKMVLKVYDELKVWTINGNPLHTYVHDKKPGDIEGGIGGWFVAREPVLDK